MLVYYVHMQHTVSVERFPEINMHGFSPMKLFTGILWRCLDQQCLLCNYSYVSVHGKTFVVH